MTLVEHSVPVDEEQAEQLAARAVRLLKGPAAAMGRGADQRRPGGCGDRDAVAALRAVRGPA